MDFIQNLPPEQVKDLINAHKAKTDALLHIATVAFVGIIELISRCSICKEMQKTKLKEVYPFCPACMALLTKLKEAMIVQQAVDDDILGMALKNMKIQGSA